ncbi:MAG: hypothetical protein JXA03_05160 [Bacteroidales bacterium]|nr:hypothetical protein [Bacteroidales bacterium]
MTTVELRNILMRKIAAIDDESFLNAIKTIIDTKSESIIYETSEEQKKKIRIGLEQIEKGEYFTNEQVETEIEQWLKEK